MASARCPDPLVLRQLVSGQLAEPESTPLEQHLAFCRRCVAMLQTQAEDDDLVRALRLPLKPHETRYLHLAEALKANLKQIRLAKMTATAATQDPSATQDVLPGDSASRAFP